MGTREGSGTKATREKKRSRGDGTLASHSDDGLQDARFASAEWDPRFSRVPKKAKKAVTDERFQEKLKSNPAFRPSATPVDRFGRPKKSIQRLEKSLQEIAQGSDESSDSDGDIKTGAGEARLVAEHLDESSSDEDDVEEDLIAQEEDEAEDIPRGKATRRLAVIGLDWSTTRAVDVFASLQSFCPAGKQIEYVEIHPSKFGLERLATEAKLGPQVVSKSDLAVVEDAEKRNLVSKQAGDKASSHDDLAFDDDLEGSEDDSDLSHEEEEEDMEMALWKSQGALRKYEEERLKYYYGVVQFEDTKAADAVYEQCDGVEYSQSGRAFDLRFIPDDMKIETKPRDVARTLPNGYAPPIVAPSSLNNSHVKLSWDADDPERVILKKKAVGKQTLDEENLRAYLAGSSEDEDVKPSADDIARKRNLLFGAAEDEDDDGEDMEMEISFEPGMLEKGEEIVKRKLEKERHKDETPWEARLRRQDERKAEKRQKRKDLSASAQEGSTVGVDVEKGNVEVNPTFESDPFFSVEQPFDKATPRASAGGKKGKKGKADNMERASEADAGEDARRREAQLELLMMDDNVATKRSDGEKSMRDMLVAVESDDDDDRLARRKGNRTRGRRRDQKLKAENGTAAKPSVLDTADPRFQGLFESHLYSMDPTHPKFKDNETTQRILQEKMKRSNRRETALRPAQSEGKELEVGVDEERGSRSSEAMELVARLKAKAAAKASAKRNSKRNNKRRA